MKKKILFSFLALVVAALLFSCHVNKSAATYDLPKGWYRAGSEPGKYEMGTDKGAGINGGNAATIKSTANIIPGFGTLMQNSVPDKYWGKRVRMSGYMKSNSVNGWAGLWLRVDGAQGKGSLAFDNMSDRPVRGTTDWKKYEIVLDVPQNATNLAYGALLAGKGQIWFSDLSFEIVDESVPSTKAPRNLNFQE